MARRRGVRFREAAARIVLAPFAAVAFAANVVAVLGWRTVGVHVQARRQWRRIRAAARTIRPDELSPRLASRGGTLILEHRSVGWNDLNLWWTEENVSGAGGPPPLPMSEVVRRLASGSVRTDFEVWCRDRYFDPDHGRGLLIAAARSHRSCAALRQRIQQLRNLHPHVGFVESWSGLLAFDETEPDAARPNASRGESPSESPSV